MSHFTFSGPPPPNFSNSQFSLPVAIPGCFDPLLGFGIGSEMVYNAFD